MDVKNRPLIAEFIRRYMIDLKPGVEHSRKGLMEYVWNTHEEQGGKKTEAKDPEGQVDMCLKQLKENGFMDNPFSGTWVRTNRVAQDSESVEASSGAEITIGSGSKTVYGWYLPLYRDVAKSNGEANFAMKIGETEVNPEDRVSQSAFAPEQPVIGFLLRCDDSKLWVRTSSRGVED